MEVCTSVFLVLLEMLALICFQKFSSNSILVIVSISTAVAASLDSSADTGGTGWGGGLQPSQHTQYLCTVLLCISTEYLFNRLIFFHLNVL